METVTINKSEYDELLRRSDVLSALEGYGVDNWDGYYDAIASLGETEEEVDDFVDKVVDTSR